MALKILLFWYLNSNNEFTLWVALFPEQVTVATENEQIMKLLSILSAQNNMGNKIIRDVPLIFYWQTFDTLFEILGHKRR